MVRGHHDVVITGLGAVTAYGAGVEPFWQGLLAGRATASPISGFDASRHPVRFACEARGFDARVHLPTRLVRRTDRFAQFGLVAAAEALEAAGLLRGGASPDPLVTGADPERVATVVASGSGGASELLAQHDRLLAGGPGRVRPYLPVAAPADAAGAEIALRHGVRGPSLAVVSACASSADALGLACDLIRAGRADVAVAGGAEASITPVHMAGFAAAGALSRRNAAPERASRPFDRDRDGFVAGEGAGILVLERAEHAAARGATALARLAGWASTTDAHHPVSPLPDGAGAARAVQLALADAGVGVRDVGHLNAHATSTPANDVAEARAVHAAFGTHTEAVVVTAPKSAVGHLLGAAGAVEAVTTVRTLMSGLVPPTQNLETQDPSCALDVVRGRPREVRAGVAVSTSIGFGGHNTALVFAGPMTPG